MNLLRTLPPGFLIAVAGLLAAFAGPALGQSAHVAPVEATRVAVFTPSPVAGATRAGRCWTTSIASPRKGAWRCMSGNVIYDPCFAPTEKARAVVCDADPLEHKSGFTLFLTEPLKAEKVPPLKTPRPWVVELDDGTRCRPYTGTMPFISGLPPLSYYCQASLSRARGEWALLGDFLTGRVWTVTKVQYVENPGKGPPLKLVSRGRVLVRAVWE